MDLNNLPEPWDVQIYYPGKSVWTKPRRCRNVYMHLTGSGGAGGAGEGGPAGTKRAGGGGGSGADSTNYYGPSVAFEDTLLIDVPPITLIGGGNLTSVRSYNNVSFPDFFSSGGKSGGDGAGGVGGVGGTYIAPGQPATPPGIIRSSYTTIGDRGLTGSNGGYSGGGTAAQGSTSLSTRGAGVTIGGGEGNGMFSSPTNTNYFVLNTNTTEGGAGLDGVVIWPYNKPFYVSTASTGGNSSSTGQGGRGGTAQIGCGGGGGGAGITGGAGGSGGHGIAIIITW